MSTILETTLFIYPPAKRILFPEPAPARPPLASLNWVVDQIPVDASYISTVLVGVYATKSKPPAKRILPPAAAAATTHPWDNLADPVKLTPDWELLLVHEE